MEENKDSSLLIIELDSYESVPRVYYKGEEITSKVKILFEWETDTDTKKQPRILIKYAEQVKYGEREGDVCYLGKAIQY